MNPQFKPEENALLYTVSNLASILYELKDFDQAKQYLTQALDILKRTNKEGSLLGIKTMNQLGDIELFHK